MFGRIRASPSSLESLEGSPSKILKDDSFSIYEATLMKLKLGAQRDLSASSEEMDEAMNDSTVSSSCVDEANVDPLPASISPSVGTMVVDTDYSCSSITTSSGFSDNVSTGNSEPRVNNNVSILYFFSKFKDPTHTSSMSSFGGSTSLKNGCSGSVSSSSIESHYRSEITEMKNIQSFSRLKIYK